MAIFDDGLLQISLLHPDDQTRTLTFEVGPEEMAEFIFGMQTGEIAIRSLPAILATMVADGRRSTEAVLGPIFSEQLLAARNPPPQEIAALAHAAIVCSDDPVRVASDLEVPQNASRYARVFGTSVFETYRNMCVDIGVPELPAATDLDAVSDVPTLILSGALDARPPVFRSEEAARHLPRSALIVFPEGTHVQLGDVSLRAAEVVVRFLAAPADPIDAGCIAEMPRRGFVLLDGTMSVGPEA